MRMDDMDIDALCFAIPMLLVEIALIVMIVKSFF